MTYGVSNGQVTDNVTWPQRWCDTVRSAILATAWLLVLSFDSHGNSAQTMWQQCVTCTVHYSDNSC